MADETRLSETESRIVGIIREHLGIKEVISLDSDLTKDLGADSLDLQEIMMVIEDDYEGKKLEIRPQDVGSLRTVRDIVNYVDSYKK